jgi:hypothetical protein
MRSVYISYTRRCCVCCHDTGQIENDEALQPRKRAGKGKGKAVKFADSDGDEDGEDMLVPKNLSQKILREVITGGTLTVSGWWLCDRVDFRHPGTLATPRS